MPCLRYPFSSDRLNCIRAGGLNKTYEALSQGCWPDLLGPCCIQCTPFPTEGNGQRRRPWNRFAWFNLLPRLLMGKSTRLLLLVWTILCFSPFNRDWQWEALVSQPLGCVNLFARFWWVEQNDQSKRRQNLAFDRTSIASELFVHWFKQDPSMLTSLPFSRSLCYIRFCTDFPLCALHMMWHACILFPFFPYCSIFFSFFPILFLKRASLLQMLTLLTSNDLWNAQRETPFADESCMSVFCLPCMSIGYIAVPLAEPAGNYYVHPTIVIVFCFQLQMVKSAEQHTASCCLPHAARHVSLAWTKSSTWLCVFEHEDRAAHWPVLQHGQGPLLIFIAPCYCTMLMWMVNEQDHWFGKFIFCLALSKFLLGGLEFSCSFSFLAGRLCFTQLALQSLEHQPFSFCLAFAYCWIFPLSLPANMIPIEGSQPVLDQGNLLSWFHVGSTPCLYRFFLFLFLFLIPKEHPETLYQAPVPVVMVGYWMTIALSRLLFRAFWRLAASL